MPKLLKYVDVVWKKNGQVYFYFRRRGTRKPLPSAYNSPEFLEAYWALRNRKPETIEVAADRTQPGSVNAAIVAF